MVRSEEETRDVMAFFASRLYLRNVALENAPGVVEVKP